ncbi:MAG: response regulator, partial [Phormidesmis sp.]
LQSVSLHYEHWNYTALAQRVKLGQFRYDQFSEIIESCVAEDFFDILQTGSAQRQAQPPHLSVGSTYKTQTKPANSLSFIMIHYERVWHKAQQEWQAWQQAGLSEFSPDWALAIAQPERLKTQTSPETFQTLTNCIDGKSTLRDLAIQLRQPIIPLTKFVLPYVANQALKLTEIPDTLENVHHGFRLEPSVDQPQAARRVSSVSIVNPNQTALKRSSLKKAKNNTPKTAPKVIYIDDSPADSHLMCNIIERLGYEYINIADPIQALPMLLELKPKLIFLDLVMPIANGYEICSQIRRVSMFKGIPVIIVTSNDGIADRVRAKIVGASGFMGKPIRASKVEKVLQKHLRSSETGDSSADRQGQRTVSIPPRNTHNNDATTDPNTALNTAPKNVKRDSWQPL